MKNLVETIVNYLANGLELLTAIVIAHSALLAVYNYFADAFSKRVGLKPKLEIRLALGRSLTVALEILLAADILKTAVAPSWNDIGQLAAIAAIRTALNFFLERELEKSKSEHENNIET
jgi:uncharacterized membrane protein